MRDKMTCGFPNMRRLFSVGCSVGHPIREGGMMRGTLLCVRHAALPIVLAVVLASGSPAQGCVGDCDRTCNVQVNELVIGVNLALGIAAIEQCAAMDANRDGMVVINELVTAVSNALTGCPDTPAEIVRPSDGVLVSAGTVAAEIHVPPGGALTAVELDGEDVSDRFTSVGLGDSAELVDVAPGTHTLAARTYCGPPVEAMFEAIALHDPGECEVLNDAECLLPYPSSRFLVSDPDTATGYRLNIPAAGLPMPNGPPLSPEPLNTVDGFSPTVQILMHFPQGVDLVASDAPRLLPPACCGQPAGPPWIDTRTSDARSLAPDSPSVLLDAATGERVLHWLENDAHADTPERRALIMRPGESLIPGHRYLVAMRTLRTADDAPIVAEPAFAALRDGRPTAIEAIEARRAAMEALFGNLEQHGIAREDLVLAFDFVVQSEAQLTGAMLSMRDQAFAWLEDVEAEPEERTFSVTSVVDHDCGAPGAVTWREIAGTFQSPLFLTRDPNEPGVGFLNRGPDGTPQQNGFTAASFGITIPCSILAENGPVPHPIVVGHGLFGRGPDMSRTVPALAGAVVPWTYIAGGTDWRGLSNLDLNWLIQEIVGVGTTRLNDFAGLPDRLRQGMLNTLVLGRMMKRGLFNRDAETFRTPDGRPVFPGPEEEMFYYGISLGGIMGTWLAALTPDVERFGVDVPAINFSCLLQRSTQFGQFETLLRTQGLTDPMDTVLGLQLLHELWVAGEPAGYARHITRDPLPGSGGPKRILMTPAWLDKQVSNQCTEIAARTLGLPNLVPASLQRELPLIPDREGPLDSAYVMFDTGSFDLFNPAHQPFIPPLANVIPSAVCDPHGARPLIPAGIRMLANFLRPGGQIENFCNDICDAGEPDEIGGGAAVPCNPTP